MFNLIEGQTYSIEYRDLLGNLTARVVRVVEVHPAYVRAYCFTAKHARTFRFKDITNVSLVSTPVAYSMFVRATDVPAVWL